MADILDKYVNFPERINKRKRDELKKTLTDAGMQNLFSKRINAIQNTLSLDTTSDLEDVFIFPGDIADIVDRKFTFWFRTRDSRALAFYCGFIGKPFSDVFEKDAADFIPEELIQPPPPKASRPKPAGEKTVTGKRRFAKMKRPRIAGGVFRRASDENKAQTG